MQRQSSTSLTGRVKHLRLEFAWKLLQQLEYLATQVSSIATTLTQMWVRSSDRSKATCRLQVTLLLISNYADLARSFVSEWSTLINIPLCITVPMAHGSPSGTAHREGDSPKGPGIPTKLLQ